MKRLWNVLFAAALALPAALSWPVAPAHAQYAGFGQVLCAPDAAVGPPGPRRVVNTTSTATPQPSYTLNGQGCASIGQADVGFFLSQGYTPGSNLFSINLQYTTSNGLPVTGTSNSPVLPAGAFLHNIIVNEIGNQTVIGGLDVGTAASGTGIVSALTVGSQALAYVTDANLKTRVFASGTNLGSPIAQQIFFTCHTSCTGAKLDITILYSLY